MARSTDPGVPLSHYREHHGCGVRFTCLDCMHARDIDLEVVISRLKARGIGDEETGIKAVAGFAERGCDRCGSFRFESSPAWAPGRDKAG